MSDVKDVRFVADEGRKVNAKPVDELTDFERSVDAEIIEWAKLDPETQGLGYKELVDRYWRSVLDTMGIKKIYPV